MAYLYLRPDPGTSGDLPGVVAWRRAAEALGPTVTGWIDARTTISGKHMPRMWWWENPVVADVVADVARRGTVEVRDVRRMLLDRGFHDPTDASWRRLPNLLRVVGPGPRTGRTGLPSALVEAWRCPFCPEGPALRVLGRADVPGGLVCPDCRRPPVEGSPRVPDGVWDATLEEAAARARTACVGQPVCYWRSDPRTYEATLWAVANGEATTPGHPDPGLYARYCGSKGGLPPLVAHPGPVVRFTDDRGLIASRSREVRAWARRTGRTVAVTGTVSADLFAEYGREHPELAAREGDAG